MRCDLEVHVELRLKHIAQTCVLDLYMCLQVFQHCISGSGDCGKMRESKGTGLDLVIPFDHFWDARIWSRHVRVLFNGVCYSEVALNSFSRI